MTNLPQRWISTNQFSEVAAISRQKAHRALRLCFEGQLWRGCHLEVAKGFGRGGKAGQQYLVKLDTLPTEIQERALRLFPHLGSQEDCQTIECGRQRRSDKGKSRPWPPPRIREKLKLSSEQCCEIDRELRDKGKRLLHTGIGVRHAREYLSHDARDLCRSAGCTLPEAQLRKLCQISRHFFKTIWTGKFVPTKLNDAKAWADRLPGVTRDWSRLASPMSLLIGDVTPLDIFFMGDDGRMLKIRIIAWVDGKTRRLFVHVYAPPKGEGVRMEHVAASLVWVCQEAGMPEAVYVDRGSEYRCMQMVANAGLFTLIKSLPYNARAKIIESIFASWQRFIAEIPGFMGTDRSHMKTENVGRPKKPFSGTLYDLVELVLDSNRHYNLTPQEALGGISPEQAWQSEVEAGWQPRKADAATLVEALCRKVERTVTLGKIRLDGKVYTADELYRRADLEGEKVTVGKSLFGFPPSVFDRTGAFVCLLEPEVSYHPQDPAGAIESARRKRIRNQGGRELLTEHPPADLQDYRRRVIGQHPPLIEPAAAQLVELPGAAGQAATARRERASDLPHTDNLRALPEPDDEPEEDYYEMLFEAQKQRGER